jgi:hypothetical protein
MPQLLHADMTDKAWRVYYTVYSSGAAGLAVIHREQTTPALAPERSAGASVGEVTFQHFIVDEKAALASVAVTEIGKSEQNQVRTIMRRQGLRLGMIANFQGEKLDVK